MNKIMVFVLVVLLLGGCQEEIPQLELQPEPQEAETAQITPAAYYEYLRCNQGENYSTETSQAFVGDWNAAVNEMEYDNNKSSFFNK